MEVCLRKVSRPVSVTSDPAPLVLDTIEKIVSISGNATTVLVAVFGVYAFFKHRNKLSGLIRYLRFAYVSERSKRLQDTLGKLDGLNYDIKTDRAEVFALIGQISGQLKALDTEKPRFASIQAEVDAILERKQKLTEAHKRRILYSIQSALDAMNHGHLHNISEPENQ